MPQLMPFSQISLFPQCLLVSLFPNVLINLFLKIAIAHVSMEAEERFGRSLEIPSRLD
jgi:hypothetical protein